MTFEPTRTKDKNFYILNPKLSTFIRGGLYFYLKTTSSFFCEIREVIFVEKSLFFCEKTTFFLYRTPLFFFEKFYGLKYLGESGFSYRPFFI